VAGTPGALGDAIEDGCHHHNGERDLCPVVNVAVTGPLYRVGVALPLPVSLSPSKVSSFKDCALAFRFSTIDRIPEPPTIWAAKGTLVHRALELLYCEPPERRTIDIALAHLEAATPEVLANREYVDLSFADADEEEAFMVDCERLVRNVFVIERPSEIRPIGLELKMAVTLGTLTLRGIIDRLELGPNDELIVTDYKTGKVPGVAQEQSRLGGVHFYALLCEKILGRRPDAVQLVYLTEPVSIITEPTAQSIRGMQIKTTAIWTAVEKACEREDFRPKPSRLCDWCSFQAWCPSFGGDPSQAPSRLSSAPVDLLPSALDGAVESQRADDAAALESINDGMLSTATS
jgi:putative RecB family exonuclease